MEVVSISMTPRFHSMPMRRKFSTLKSLTKKPHRSTKKQTSISAASVELAISSENLKLHIVASAITASLGLTITVICSITVLESVT